MIKGTNGISDSASIHLALGDSDTGFKWISDGVCKMYANNIAIGQWNSGGMNWLKQPTVNGQKIWHAGNDGSGSGLDADLLDGYHFTSFPLKIGGSLYAISTHPSIKLFKFTRTNEKGWISLSVYDSNNGATGVAAKYMLRWSYTTNETKSITLKCIYYTSYDVSTKLTAVRISGGTYEIYYTPNDYGSEV
jgi:hypothetical protein|nr:MAG TPA: hypothetical protein [Bacteriophage sp.]